MLLGNKTGRIQLFGPTCFTIPSFGQKCIKQDQSETDLWTLILAGSSLAQDGAFTEIRKILNRPGRPTLHFVD